MVLSAANLLPCFVLDCELAAVTNISDQRIASHPGTKYSRTSHKGPAKIS